MKIIIYLTMFIFLNAQKDSTVVNTFLNNWHRAASVSDAVTFFDSMSEDANYIGTDATEYWTKTEFIAWARPHFKKKSAWTLTPIKRHLYFSKDAKTVWFDEKLTTGMGECRGSGILIYEDNVWKIKQYVLSLAIPNDLINDVKKLVDEFSKPKQ